MVCCCPRGQHPSRRRQMMLSYALWVDGVHELPDAEWKFNRPLLPRPSRGRSWSDDRSILNGIVWQFRAGVPWRDVPERYGSWATLHTRFRRWAKDGTLPGQPYHRRPLGRPLPALGSRREPVRLAARCGIAASTAHRILRRHGLPALAACDRATGEPVRRYERSRPDQLLHIDVKKLGRIPDGGGHRFLGRAAGSPNKDRRNGAGYAYLHTTLDDHTRLAYTEDLPDETAATCAGFLTRAAAWFARQGVTIERFLTGNAWAYTKNTWRDTSRDLGISPRWTRPWRPQERRGRTFPPPPARRMGLPARPYASDAERQAAFSRLAGLVRLPPTPHRHHRPHPSQPCHQPVQTAHLGGCLARTEVGHTLHGLVHAVDDVRDPEAATEADRDDE